jgi:hypothetical protein
MPGSLVWGGLTSCYINTPFCPQFGKRRLRVKFMKWLAIFVFVPSAALASVEPEGNHSAFHSGFYDGLFNQKKAITCCHNKDCRPTVSKMVGDHYEIKLNGHWMPVEKDTIIPKTAPDGGAHVCAGDPSSADPLGRVYCVILPPET